MRAQYQKAFIRYNGDSKKIGRATAKTLNSILFSLGSKHRFTAGQTISAVYAVFGTEIFDHIRLKEVPIMI